MTNKPNPIEGKLGVSYSYQELLDYCNMTGACLSRLNRVRGMVTIIERKGREEVCTNYREFFTGKYDGWGGIYRYKKV